MRHVTSKDGTVIAFEQSGSGPVVIIVTGALGVYSVDMAARLASRFTVFDMARRGRGESGDTAPYAVEREIEDIDALIDAAGGSASLYGMSSGAILAVKAAKVLGGKVKKIALYEPPFIVDDSFPALPTDYVDKLNAAIADSRRGDAVEIFMTEAMHIPAEYVAYMRNAPAQEVSPGVKPPQWADMETVAHTLAYDGMIVRDVMTGKPWSATYWKGVTAPTLIITGDGSEPFFHVGAKALVASLPKAEHRLLAGQNHAVSTDALAPVLIDFLAN